MVNIIDMRSLRYLNLFEKITRVSTKYCFDYNNAIIFAVPKKLIKNSLGRGAENIKRIGSIIKKRVRIVAIPNSIDDAKSFIESVISPVTFNDLEITENEIILTAGSQSKAALIGRNKRRLLEMQEIVRDFFKKEFRIV